MSDYDHVLEDVTSSNRGIPTMNAVGDVGAWLKNEGELSAEDGISKLEENYRKYKMVEGGMTQQKLRLLEKIPEFQNSMKLLNVLIEKKEKGESFETSHLVADEVWTRAVVKEPKTVCIWVGANIMVEYELDKAKAMLLKNMDKVKTQIRELNRELAFVKDQITTTEVNIAHVHNHNVRLKKQHSKLMASA